MNADLKAASASEDNDDVEKAVQDSLAWKEPETEAPRNLRAKSKGSKAVVATAPKSVNFKAEGKSAKADTKPKKEVATPPLSSNLPETESSMEKTLTEMMMSGGDLSATPFGDSVQQIRDLIEKDMMKKVLDAHKNNQEELYKQRRDLEECGITKDVSVEKADI